MMDCGEYRCGGGVPQLKSAGGDGGMSGVGGRGFGFVSRNSAWGVWAFVDRCGFLLRGGGEGKAGEPRSHGARKRCGGFSWALLASWR